MDTEAAVLEAIWINHHGHPLYVSADMKFLNKFTKESHYFGVKFNPVHARRQNKLGVVERKSAIIRLLTEECEERY